MGNVYVVFMSFLLFFVFNFEHKKKNWIGKKWLTFNNSV